jgi:hypothetical protein
MSASNDQKGDKSRHIEVLPKRSTDQPLSPIDLAGATPLRQPAGSPRGGFEFVEVSSAGRLIARPPSRLPPGVRLDRCVELEDRLASCRRNRYGPSAQSAALE